MKRQRSLAYQLSLRYALLIIIAFALVFASFYTIMSRTVVRERTHVLNQRLSIVADSLDNRLSSVMALQSSLLNDETLQSALKSPGVSMSLSAQLARYRSSSYLFNALYLFDSHFNALGMSRPTTTAGGIEAELREAVQDFARSYAFRRFTVTSEGTLYFLFALYPPENYRYIAYGAAEINQERLFFDFSRNAMEVFHAVSVTDDDQTITRIDPDRLFEVGEGPDQWSEASGSHAAFEAACDVYAQWHILALYDQSALMSASTTQLRVLLAIFLITVLVALAVSLLMARSIVKPIHLILDSMSHLEKGEYPPPLPIHRNDEIGQLVVGYNHAVTRLAELNRDVLSEQQEKRRYEVLSIKTQLDLLQSQINPHFIHNTLNTLHFMALRDGNREIGEVITSFNALLRASLGNASDFSTVEEEIDYVRRYMLIQRHRYADRQVACDCQLDEAAGAALLPRLILQPLVENSLFHGILPNADMPGRITIRCRVAGDRLEVAVADNGVGMSESRMREVSGSGDYPASNSFNRIGIRNVRERLNLLYNEECGFTIESAEGRGTTISFSVPYRR